MLDIDADAGAVRLRLLGSCDGCPSSSITLQMAVERAITEAAPEIVRLEVDEPSKAADLEHRSHWDPRWPFREPLPRDHSRKARLHGVPC